MLAVRGFTGLLAISARCFSRRLGSTSKHKPLSSFGELDEPDADARSIHALFERIGDVSKTAFGRVGCFMANTANDGMINDVDVHSEVLRHLKRTSARFEVVLKRDGRDPVRARDLADYLTGLLQGLFVLAHGGAEHRMIDAHVSKGLRVLDE